MRATLRTDHGTYVRVEEGGGRIGALVTDGHGTRPAGLLTGRGEDDTAWQQIDLIPSAGSTRVVYLRSAGYVDADGTVQRRYACCEDEGRAEIVVCNRDVPGAWEAFLLHTDPVDRRTSFEAVCRPGWFLAAQPDGRVVLAQPKVWDEAMQTMVPSSVPGGYEKFVVRMAASVPSGPPTGVVPAGMTRLSGRGFADDTGPYLCVSATHMDALNLYHTDRDRFHANVATLASKGVRCQRVLGILGWAAGEGVVPTEPWYWDAWVYVIEYAYAQHVKTQVTLFADLFAAPALQRQSARLAFCDRAIEVFGPRRHMIEFIEGCNEPGNGQLWANYGSPQDLVDVSRKLGDALGLPYAAGALYGGNDGSTTGWHLSEGVIAPEAKTLINGCPITSVHLSRGLGANEELWRVIRQPWEGMSSAGSKAWVNNEPVGHDSSVTKFNDAHLLARTPLHPTDRDLHRIAALSTFMSGGALYCWHTEGGTGYSSDRPIAGETGLDEVMAAQAVLPPDLPNWQKHNWHWSSNPVQTVEGCVYDRGMAGKGTLRTLAATHDGRVALYVFCVPESATLRARYAMDLDTYAWDGTRYTQVAQLHVEQGQTFVVGRCLDALYLGRFA
jgi:hypothetical protein